MAHFGSNEAWIRYKQAEGFRVGACECRQCGHKWQTAIHPETVAWRLECPRCHKQDNWFTEFNAEARND